MIESLIAGAAGSMISGLFGQSSANKSMNFQREAAQNAHQWQVEDMRKAGLNPILSAGGSGARPAGGAQATMPDMGSTAMQNQLNKEQMKNVSEDTGKKIQERYLAGALTDKAQADARVSNKTEKLVNEQIEQARNSAKGTALDNTYKAATEKLFKDPELGPMLRFIQMFVRPR